MHRAAVRLHAPRGDARHGIGSHGLATRQDKGQRRDPGCRGVSANSHALNHRQTPTSPTPSLCPSLVSRVARRNVPSNSQCRNETPRTPLTPVVSSPRTSFTSASPLSRRHPKREPSGDPPEYRFRRTSTCFHTYNEPNRPSVTLTTALIPFTLTPPSTPTSTPTPTSTLHPTTFKHRPSTPRPSGQFQVSRDVQRFSPTPNFR